MLNNTIKTLVILAAGRGSRFGGAKQFAQFGTLKKSLMEYNIYHAIEAGFTHIIFITHQQYQVQLTEQVIKNLPENMSHNVVFQCLKRLPKGCNISPLRTKPLGTAHALWCAKEVINDPFIVINADDYYGEHAFQLVRNIAIHSSAMVAYRLVKTLSEHGGVNRGLCQLSAESSLNNITEITNIKRTPTHEIVGTFPNNSLKALAEESLISMNFWCLNEHIFPVLTELLLQTFSEQSNEDKECYLPDAIALLNTQTAQKTRVLTSHDAWFGVTYAADSPYVNKAITTLINEGKFTHLSNNTHRSMESR